MQHVTALAALVLVGCTPPPPTVTITRPDPGFVQDFGGTITFAGTVADKADDAAELSVTWSSSIDGLLASAPSHESGVNALATAGLSRGRHTVTLQATNSRGASAAQTVELTVNGPPQAPVIRLDPDDPISSYILGAVIEKEAFDAEGDAITYRFQWSVDGVEVEGHTRQSLDPSFTQRDQVWSVSVTPNDGRIDGRPATALVYINNTLPTIDDVVLRFSNRGTNGVASVLAPITDIDQDDLNVSYLWMVNGAPVSATGTTLDGKDWFDRDDEVAVEVSATDHTGEGPSVLSDTFRIANSRPTEVEAYVVPTYSRGDRPVVCELTAEAFDEDNDPLSYIITWSADGKSYPYSFADAVGPATTKLPGDTVSAEDMDLADVFICTMVASDGSADGRPGSAWFPAGPTTTRGYPTQFSSNTELSADVLVAFPITIDDWDTAVELGILAKEAAEGGKMAIYSDKGGTPDALIRSTSYQPIAAGENVFPIVAGDYSAGTYWVAVVVSASTSVYSDDRSTRRAYSLGMSARGEFPTALSSATPILMQVPNYYVVVME